MKDNIVCVCSSFFFVVPMPLRTCSGLVLFRVAPPAWKMMLINGKPEGGNPTGAGPTVRAPNFLQIGTPLDGAAGAEREERRGKKPVLGQTLCCAGEALAIAIKQIATKWTIKLARPGLSIRYSWSSGPQKNNGIFLLLFFRCMCVYCYVSLCRKVPIFETPP